MRDTLKRQPRVRQFMDRLAQDPPQVVLLEGGTPGQRMDMGLYMAAAFNCRKDGGACLECPECARMLERADRDLFGFDCAEAPPPIEDLRKVLPEFSQPPRGDGKRAVIFSEAQYLNLNCANLLLKSLEEPRPHTVFMLLVPQRDRLLPTLVSRSWVLTLSWHTGGPSTEAEREWLTAVAEFLVTGRGFFARTSQKGAVNRDLAQAVVAGCQRELASAMAGDVSSPLAKVLSRLSPAGLRRFDLALAQATEALSTPTPVHPALVLDWLVSRMVSVR